MTTLLTNTFDAHCVQCKDGCGDGRRCSPKHRSMFKHVISWCLAAFFAPSFMSQSDISVEVQQPETGYITALSAEVTLTSSDSLTAGQWDVHYDADRLEFLNATAPPSLSGDLQSMVQHMEPGVLRVILFSLTNDPALPLEDGWKWALDFETKYTHGPTPFSIQNSLLVGTSGESLVPTTHGDEGLVVGPLFDLVTSEVVFGDVPMLSEATLGVEVSNAGNAPLTLEALDIASPFTLLEELPLVVEAEATTTLTVAVSTEAKVDASAQFNVVSSDPAPLRTTQSFAVSANVFAVNELRLDGANAVLGEPFEVSLAANNMEPFSAFQLDVVLPEGVLLVADSEAWSGREADHSLALSQVGPNTVRLLGFSPTNAEFLGVDGELCSFQLVSNESTSSLALGVSGGLMSNVDLGDVMSEAFGTIVSQAYPTLAFQSTTNLGVVPEGVAQFFVLTFSNFGGAPLVMEDLQAQTDDVNVISPFPRTVLPGTSADVLVSYTPSSAGEVLEELALTHNAEGGFSEVFLEASVIRPNYVYFQDDFAPVGGTWSSEIHLSNVDAVKGMQFDLELPQGVAVDAQDFSISSALPNFQLSASELGDNAFRLIVFSLSGASVPAGDHPLVTCQGAVASDMIQGAYDLPFTNVILSDVSNANVATVALNLGQMTVNCAEDLDGDGVCDGCAGDLDACGVCNGPGEVYDCGCEGIPAGDCDCEGNQLDVVGVCGGGCTADVDSDGICDDVDDCVGAFDGCGVCNGPGAIFDCGCSGVPEGDCDCNGNVLDECGICNGPGPAFECGCTNIPSGDCDCNGNELDALGVCGGSCAQDLDQDGICDDEDSCVGTLDACGICNGPGAIYACGCTSLDVGACDCFGNVLDALGVCGGDCMADADGDGVCDDVDTCVGALDACGICNGPGAVYDCGCSGIPAGDCDCNGSQSDALGVCGGLCESDADGDGVCDSIDVCVGVVDGCGVCNGQGAVYDCGCADIACGDCDCNGNQLDALGVCGGTCISDVDNDGVCDYLDDCIGIVDECGVCNGPGAVYDCGCSAIPAGDCDCNGNQFDALGVCGGSCTDDDGNSLCDQHEGCTYALAINYDLEALFDNGSCVFGIDQSCPADFNGDNAVGSADLLIFLSEFGLECP